MRYLTENKEYRICYAFDHRYGKKIIAFLEDKETGKLNISKEKLMDGDLEKCLMKLGKRLIQRWRKRNESKRYIKSI